MEAQLSSDDRTDYILIEVSDVKMIAKMASVIEAYQTWIGKVFNLKQNYKKRRLSVILFEFNSLFMVGRRMLPTTIKDLRTVLVVPDSTYMEQAVKEFVAGEQGLMMNLFSPDTQELTRAFNRTFLVFAYKLWDTIEIFMRRLGIEGRSRPPTTLGFLPIDHLYVSLLMGTDVYTRVRKDNALIDKFYSWVFSGQVSAEDEGEAPRGTVIHGMEIVGKRGLRSSIKSDPKVRQMKGYWGIDTEMSKANMESNFFATPNKPETRDELMAGFGYYLSNIRLLNGVADASKVVSLTGALMASRHSQILFGVPFSATEMHVIQFTDMALSDERRSPSVMSHPMYACMYVCIYIYCI